MRNILFHKIHNKFRSGKSRVFRYGKGLPVLLLTVLLLGCKAKEEDGTRLSLEEVLQEDGESIEILSGAKVSEIKGAKNVPENISERDDPQGKVPEEEMEIGTEDTRPECYVYICGAVKHPGVYCLKDGSRIYQAIDAAGGFLPEASMDYVNQAQEIADGMKVVIPTVTEVSNGAAVGIADSAVQRSSEEQGASGGKVNINTASESELCTLSGIGASKARSIIAYREKQGGFKKPEDIMKISGIKESSYAKIKDNITVS